MKKYILKRLAYLVVVFFLTSFLMYALYTLVPSDPARNKLEPMKKTLKPEQYEALYKQTRIEMGLDDSIFVRYARWIGFAKQTEANGGKISGLLEGNFGTSSFFQKPCIEVIGPPMGNTVFINIFATILALGITIPLGIYCAVHKNKAFDKTTQVVTMIGYSIPSYIVCLVFMYVFAIILGWFPVSGMGTPGANYTGFRAFTDKLYYICLPLICMTFASLGGMTRYVRAAMIDALSMDHIKTARAKGVKEKVVIYSHAWRNALLPVVTLVIGWFMGIFAGSVVVEQTFSLNGMGKLYLQALNNHDYELTLAIQMFYSVVSLVGYLVTDLSYGLVDPRVRVDK